jgi:hypothetical protein
MTGSPTKWSAACFNISLAIVASGRERRRISQRRLTMTTLTVPSVGLRALPRERSPHSTFAVAALGLAVVAAVAIAIALAILNLPDNGTIYVTVT